MDSLGCIVGREDRTECNTECLTKEVDTGKFVKKCVTTKKTTRRCFKSSSVREVHFSTVHTEENVAGPEVELTEKQAHTDERASCRLM